VQCSIIVTHHSTHTAQTEILHFIRTVILGLITLISTYLTNLPHRQLLWEVWHSEQWILYQISCHTMVQPSICFIQLHENTRQTVGTVNWAQFKVNVWSWSLWNMEDRTDLFLGYFIRPPRCKHSFSFISMGTFMMP